MLREVLLGIDDVEEEEGRFAWSSSQNSYIRSRLVLFSFSVFSLVIFPDPWVEHLGWGAAFLYRYHAAVSVFHMCYVWAFFFFTSREGGLSIVGCGGCIIPKIFIHFNYGLVDVWS